ncbi:MAG: enoyl-CoA hydratase-related protein [bacterium]
MGDALLTELDEAGVLLATLNRPEAMNSLSAELSAGLLQTLDRASRDDDVRALVLTGAGRAFCAGANISGSTNPTSGGPGSRFGRMDRRSGSAETILAFANCDVPIIGAINGPAAGGGFGLALACDVRFMGESARIGSIFAKRGIGPDYGVSYWLPRIVGVARAFEIIYDANLLDAETALACGLVQRVVPDDELLDAALGFARKIAAGPPMAHTNSRRLLVRAQELPIAEFLELEWSNQRALLRTNDAAEGFASFVEKRGPVFTGE